MDNKNNKNWTSSILAKLGVVRSEVAPSQGQATAHNRKFLTALTVAATAAIGGMSTDNAMADGYSAASHASDLAYVQDNFASIAKANAIDAENPYTSDYKIAEREANFVSKANNFFQDPLGLAPDPTTSFVPSVEEKTSSEESKDVAKEMYRNAIGKTTTEKVINGMGVLMNPIASISEKVSGIAVGAGTTALTGNEEVGKTTGSVIGEGVGLAAGYAVLPHVAVVSAGYNAVAGAFNIADSLQQEDHDNAQKAVNKARERMAEIYAQERQSIQAQQTMPQTAMLAAERAIGSDLPASDDIEALMADDNDNNKNVDYDGPSM
jgi:hypothetical protein